MKNKEKIIVDKPVDNVDNSLKSPLHFLLMSNGFYRPGRRLRKVNREKVEKNRKIIFTFSLLTKQFPTAAGWDCGKPSGEYTKCNTLAPAWEKTENKLDIITATQ